jgi:hypothetical protein
LVKTEIVVSSSSGAGHADVKLAFNSSPVITALSSDPSWLEAGVPTSLVVQATDPDGDSLTYSWSSTSAGDFGGGTAANSFTLNASGSATSATVTVVVTESAQTVTLGGVSGQLVASFALSTTATFVGGTWLPGSGTKTYGNFNAYALIFVPASDPTLALTAEQINWLAYADCTADGLMGKTCMTGTTVAAYGRVGTMSGYPVAQVTTLR